MYRHFFLCSLLLSACNGAARMAQSVAPRSGIDLCAMFDHRVAIVGDQLFFMSGTYIFEVAIMASRQPNLMWLDLNTTFPVETFIANASIGLSHIPSYDPAQDSGGSFFYDNTTVYVFAGLGDVDHVITNQLKSYNASAKNWSDVAVAGGNFNRGSRFKGLHTSDPGTGRSWYSGGFDTNIRGMIQFDSSVSTGPTWTNTTSVMTEISGANNLGGELVFVPMGQAGVLIAIGGYDTSQPGTQYNGSDLNFNNVPLNRISVYDIYSSTWYGVNATGDTPSQRVEFCSSVSPSPDLSSFQITIYGGFDMKVPRAFEDIYVLSIPSFRWIKVNDASNPGNAEYTNSNVGRQGHKCVLWKDSQMIVLGGGIKIGPNDGNAQGCNTDYPPIKVLNTANFTWQSRFDPKGAAYEVPKVVYDVIGGDSKGNATLRIPERGWNSTALERIFGHPFARIVPPTSFQASPQLYNSSQANVSTTAPLTPSLFIAPSDSPPQDTKTSPKVIAGAVVGSIAGVTALLICIFFLFRRKKREEPEVNDSKSITAEMPGPYVETHEVSGEIPTHELPVAWEGPELAGMPPEKELSEPLPQSVSPESPEGVESPVIAGNRSMI